MRIRILIISCLVMSCIACKEKAPVQKATTPFDYLLGDWERTNSKAGSETFEHWKTVTATELRGHGYTLEDEDTVFNERIRLVQKKNEWQLHISGPNETPTVFKITENDGKSFTAVNPENEFPKVIKYSYFDDVLTATISSEEMEIPFIFWRVED